LLQVGLKLIDARDILNTECGKIIYKIEGNLEGFRTIPLTGF
jgi:hypothetical protein